MHTAAWAVCTRKDLRSTPKSHITIIPGRQRRFRQIVTTTVLRWNTYILRPRDKDEFQALKENCIPPLENH